MIPCNENKPDGNIGGIAPNKEKICMDSIILNTDDTAELPPPESGTRIDTRRVRIHPDHWYPMAWSHEVKAGKTHAVGRWCWLRAANAEVMTAGQRDEAIASTCRTLLRRYGVLFRELMEREQFAVRWRDLLAMLRRMEARGEVRGGRFVTGVSGEQYALPEAMVSLREFRNFRNQARPHGTVDVAAADPLNLAGILLPGERIAAMAGKRAVLVPSEETGAQPDSAAGNQVAGYALIGGISGGGGGGISLGGAGGGGYINAASGG